MTRNPILVSTILAAAVAAVPGVMTTAGAEGFEERASFSGRELTVTDLIGDVRIEGSEGSDFEVVIAVRGKDASRDRIRIEKAAGDHARLDIIFPVKGESKFVYPPLGDHSNTTIAVGNHEEDPLGALLRSLGGRRIRVSGRGSGLEAWADVTIRVPRDRTLEIDLGVGSIAAAKIASTLHLRAQSGPVTASDVRGDLVADTGSGAVSLDDVQGSALAVDTGSGEVRISRAACRKISVDTGSGAVIAKGIATDDLNIDTGSGSIELRLDRVGPGSYHVDTGSGTIDLTLPGDASAEVVAETASGHIDIDTGTVKILSRDEDSIAFRMGDGAADISVETGSGSISISN